MKNLGRFRKEMGSWATHWLFAWAVLVCPALALVACGSEADDPDWWAEQDGGADTGQTGGNSGTGGAAGTGVSGGGGSLGGTGGDPGTGGTSGTGGDPGTGGTSGTSGTGGDPGTGGTSGTGVDILKGYWVWEDRVSGTTSLGFAHLNGQAMMRMAFGTGNNKCQYIWNETTGSDFHTDCTYTISGDMVTFDAKTGSDGKIYGYSCAHPDWFSWAGDQRPPVQYGRYKFVGDRLWLGVNAYWGFGGDVTTSDGAHIPKNGSCKRFGYWESLNQATKEETWIVYKPVTEAEWNAAGYSGCDACATFPPAEVCE